LARSEAAGAPPCTAAVMLAGDHGAWQPSLAPTLWEHLRLGTLHALWTSRAASGEVACTAAGVACRIIHGVQRCINLEWKRVISDIRREADTCAGSFRGRDPQMPRADFEGRWCIGDAICKVIEDGGQPKLKMLLRPNQPVPLPVG
jgi:hypothetical protein